LADADAGAALERRRIAPIPRLRTTPIFKCDYSRDLQSTKWGSGVSLHGSLSRSGPLAEWLPPANAIIPARDHLSVADARFCP
jgi:hypothetical protein